MSEKKNDNQSKRPRPVIKDKDTDYNKYHRNYDSGNQFSDK